MNKFLLYFSLVFVILLTSCNASRNITHTTSTKQKLEVQYQLYKGIPYKYGGTDQRGFDCSGFTQKVYNNTFNIQLPRTTEAMSKIGNKISKRKLKPGDLVFFRPTRKYRHVGIFIGNNTFIHSSSSKGVSKSKLDNPYWEKKYRYAKRILKTK
ncbi:MAG: NlpC/P60 family protein [Flavobacteriaceae bacterium]|nr:NlpC/P60 family protein [Flavobacteriaceae bacterium]